MTSFDVAPHAHRRDAKNNIEEECQPPRRYSFVTIGFEEDGGLLQLQARSMRLHCSPDLIDEIIIVDNSSGSSGRWRRNLLQQYGELADLTRIVPAKAIADMPSGAHGWFTQQVLKIKVAEAVRSDRYVILDAKNHLIAHLDRQFLETSAGKPRTNGYTYVNHPMRGFLERTADYCGIDRLKCVKWFPRTTTPFTMLREEARALVQHVEQREGRSFTSVFLEKELCEFFLYSGFLVLKGVLQDLYDLTQPYEPQIWPHKACAQDCTEAICKARQSKCYFMTVHRKALANMDGEARQVMASFWREQGLFATVEDGVRFCRAPRWSRQSYHGHVKLWAVSRVLSIFRSLQL